MFRALSATLVLSLVCFAAAEHAIAGHNARRHHERVAAVQERSNSTKRQGTTYSGQATWFDVGLGACGDYSQPSDFIVALNTPQYGSGYPGPYCFMSITITYNGESQQATIMDECPTCDWGSLDMSTGLFSSFQDLGVGVFPITWWFNDGSTTGGDGGDSSSTSSTPWSDPAPWTISTSSSQWSDPAPWTTDQPTTTSSWVDPAPWTTDQPTSSPTTTWAPPTTSTSTSWVPPTTSTTPTSSSASSTSSDSVSLSGTPTTLNLAPSTTPASSPDLDTGSGGNLQVINALVVGLGQLISGGGDDSS